MGGNVIGFDGGALRVPDRPVIPAIPGDGIGPEVWSAARLVMDAAIASAFGGKRSIEWLELPAGLSALASGLEALPAGTLEALRAHRVAIKGPTTTPVGTGHRSINVTLRRKLDLYANVRPVRWFEGVPSPVRDPAALDIVVFRENTEDVYGGIEFESGSQGASRIARELAGLGHDIPPDAGIGIKVISRFRTRRLVRAAIEYAIAKDRRRVTIVHKGNIMKFTEGAFLEWGKELVREQYAGRATLASDLPDGASPPCGTIVVDDRIADATFQALLLRPRELSVIATPNLNGDYLSDAAAAQIGGLGMAPGANIGDGIALFEPVHGSAPRHAGKGTANPGSIILSGAMLLEHIGWTEAATIVVRGLESVLRSGRLTSDLARHVPGSTALSTSAFASAIASSIASP